jgi:hypothetical protein
VFCQQFEEGRHGDVEDVLAKVTSDRIDGVGGDEAGRGLNGRQEGGLIARVRDTREGAGRGGEDVLVTLVGEVDEGGGAGSLSGWGVSFLAGAEVSGRRSNRPVFARA